MLHKHKLATRTQNTPDLVKCLRGTWDRTLRVLAVGEGYTPATAHFKIPGGCSVCELILERAH